MILVLTPNPALDLTYRLPQLLVGESQRAEPAIERPGGKGLNVARVLNAQGHSVRALLPLGGHSGQLIADALTALRLPHTIVPVAGQTRRTLALVTDHETSNINETGQPLTDSEWQRFIAAFQRAAEAAQVVVISGSLPPDTPETLLPELVAVARAAGAYCLADVSGDALLAAAASGVDLLKPNEVELTAATGIADPVAAAEHLVSLGARLVLVSRGADGIIAVSGVDREVSGIGGGSGQAAQQSVRQPVQEAGLPVRWARLGRSLSGNPTGAGDAAVAACAAHFLTHEQAATASPVPFSGEALDAMLTDAVAWSTAAVLAPVAGEIADPKQFYSEILVSDYTVRTEG